MLRFKYIFFFHSLLLCILLQAATLERPNILLIVADDMGYSDLGCYGGELDTRNLDQLASEGLRFTGYQVNPMCVVTRTSLISGHTHSQSDDYRRSLPFPRLLQEAGYMTSISGKWHQPGNPIDAGFGSFYGFLHGAINSWTGQSQGKDQIQRDQQAPKPVPNGWYATDAFTDEAITQIDAALDQDKPFFAYVPYNAPHSPFHAYREDVEKYYDRYEEGWEVLREQRFERMRDMGLIDERYLETPPNPEVRRWDEMPRRTQLQEARRMAAYAGMVDRMDQGIGRLLKHLDDRGVADNTLVLFFSDNGGAYSNGNIENYDQQISWDPRSIPYTSNGWSYLRNAPFRWYKSSAESGGVSSPLIVRWPKGIQLQPGSILTQRLHVSDWYPTFLELAGITYPETDGGRSIEPLYGNSMLPLWRDPSLPDYAVHDEIFWAYNSTGKGLVQGDWKISSISDGPWRLYNVKEDPATTRNLAGEMPEKLKHMSAHWFDFAENHTEMEVSWKRPVHDYQEGWGYHRIRMVMPAYQSASPHMSQDGVPLDTDLTFNFSAPISFEQSKGKTLRLYAVSNPDQVLWQADPELKHPAVGEHSITFTDLPRLQPNTTYFLLADASWITLGGKRAGPLNDGAYWFRFRTGDS
jgi:arylsulfatase